MQPRFFLFTLFLFLPFTLWAQQLRTDAVSGATPQAGPDAGIEADEKARIKAELKAELLEELKAELSAEGVSKAEAPESSGAMTAATDSMTKPEQAATCGMTEPGAVRKKRAVSASGAGETPAPGTPTMEMVIAAAAAPAKAMKPSRLTVGGYGEAVMTRNFYSDNYLRYSQAEQYKNESHGRFDLPHVVLWLGYDFGRGWSMGTEIEFEHGGTESAVEIEEEEGGEYESEVERGGEVALEQFWIQKSFSPAFNLRMGHIIVPVGATNAHHMPTEFFGVYRPEGENTIIPCTWHETGISLWGVAGQWRYEAMFLPGLDSDRFNSRGWIHDGAGSPYEFKIGNAYAGALRVDNFSVPGLRLSLSGYAGNSFSNTLNARNNARYDKVRGTVLIGAFDFAYDAHNWVVRGNFDYGHLTDSDVITSFNGGMSASSVSSKQAVASDALATGLEAGFDFFSLSPGLHRSGQRFYVFGRYEYYDPMFKTAERVGRVEWCGRSRVAVGINYCPIRNIAIKAEYGIGLLRPQYNNEPSLSLGIAYSGIFKR